MTSLKTKIAPMVAIVKKLSLTEHALHALAREEVQVDDKLVDIFTDVSKNLHNSTIDRIKADLAPSLPDFKVEEIIKAAGLPLVKADFFRFAHTLYPNTNLFATAYFTDCEPSSLNMDQISPEEFMKELESAGTLSERAAILAAPLEILPEFLEGADVRPVEILQLRDLIRKFSKIVENATKASLAKDTYPAFEFGSLFTLKDLKFFHHTLPSVPADEIAHRIVSEISGHMTTRFDMSATLDSEGRIHITANDHSRGTVKDFDRLTEAYQKFFEACRAAEDQMTADDILKSQSLEVRALITTTEAQLVDKIDQGQLPYINFTSFIDASSCGEPYIKINDDGPILNSPMICDVFERYMRIKHDVSAMMFNETRGVIAASIDLYEFV